MVESTIPLNMFENTPKVKVTPDEAQDNSDLLAGEVESL